MSEKKNNQVSVHLSFMRKYAILLIVFISLVLICGCISVPSSPKETSPASPIPTNVPNTGTVTVIIKARAFDPKIITIREGTTVTWINEDSMMHHVVHLPKVTQAELFNSGLLSSGQSFSFRFVEKGRYEYGDPQIGGSSPSLVIVE
jgi:plastocyanin